jgi:hypothetical protein
MIEYRKKPCIIRRNLVKMFSIYQTLKKTFSASLEVEIIVFAFCMNILLL